MYLWKSLPSRTLLRQLKRGVSQEEAVPIPDWADDKLSNDLPGLRAQGEGQEIEYMEIFPQQVRELGKEIAAFASTNPGTIILGVSDEGDLVGLFDTGTLEQRDEVLRRIEGICRGTLKPAITPTVKWGVERNLNVLFIQVPKGTEPVYYSNNIPYVRHLSESRPAEPHEVVGTHMVGLKGRRPRRPL
jgi:ATP-dependent DNA helicase RecG